MHKFGFRQRNSARQVEAWPEDADEDDDDIHNPKVVSVVRPQLRQPFRSDSMVQHAPRRPHFGQVGRHASFADSTFASLENYRGVSPHGQVPDLLGLQLLCDNTEPDGDIIFVHGLGGTAMRTWSWKRDVSYFWPVWLTEEQGLSNFRIFSFGYNSDFKGASTNLNTIDFAKDLLYSMLTFSGGLLEGKEEMIPIGSRRIIFVGHSMGGLVVKKAHVLGKHDKQYSSIIAQVYGIVFLATPHRGAGYAKILNNILSTCPLGPPPKAYIAELDTSSSSLQDINEQFRVHCEKLELASFFETKKTSFGMTKVLIVEKESGILGYPQETSIPLNADHHSICKFETRDDPNYISVKNILKHWASQFLRTTSDILTRRRSSNVELKHLQTIFAIRETPETDLHVLGNRVLEGTCVWITTRPDFVSWVEAPESKNPNLFWLVGLPATGKTSLARSVVDHLQYLGHDCFYHFFSSGHQVKRTTAFCLRSLAFQIACVNAEFREHLSELVEESGIQLSSQTFSVIWEKVFEGILFKLATRKPIFLVLDGIDEGDSQAQFVSQLLKLQSEFPIRIFLTSRPMKIPSAPSRSSLTTCFIHEEDTHDDIVAYVQTVVQDALPDDPEFQADISDQVLAKASGSFLWVKLALDTLQDNWHTKEDIRKALTEVPKGMEPLYKRMLDSVKSQPPRLQLMAKRILTWATCCWRPLSVNELKVALQPEFKDFVRLEHTIIQICGHFISVDNSKITLVHATARSFLLHGADDEPAFIDPREGHEHLAIVSLKYLSRDQWRPVFKNVGVSNAKIETEGRPNRLLLAEKDHPLLVYASCYWAYHVSKSSAEARDLMAVLKVFLAKYVLSWIEGIALSGDLRYLTRSAQYLKAYAKKKPRSLDSDGKDNLLSLKESLSPSDGTKLQPWANDFIHIVGKFGRNLVQSPLSICRLIPPLCPRLSMIHATYVFPDDKTLSIAGLASEGWGDCLASLIVGEDEIASKVLATDAYFLTLISTTGTVVIWHAETCEEARRIHHSEGERNEYVPIMALNQSGTRLATAGNSTYRIWDISTGQELYRLTKRSQGLTMTTVFGSTDWELLVGLDDCSVTRYNLETSAVLSRFEPEESLQELQGCPNVMVISPDLRKVGIAWRGKPLMIWDMSDPHPLHKCRVSGSSDPLNAPELVRWQSDGNSVLILCLSSKIVEWDFCNEDQTEYGKYHDIAAREMTISADGNFLLTSDNVGTMSVWTFPRLQLIYRLLNGNEFIRDLTFSPNGQRFYDTRESMCNVWEPDALVRPDEQDLEDGSSIADSYAATEPVISHDESNLNQVTAFAVGPDDGYYCCGKEDGSVVIYESTGGKKVRKVCNHAASSSVISLAWSQSGQYLVSSDDSGRVLSKRLELKDGGKWAVFPGIDIRISEEVKQFVFSNDEKLLLIYTPSKSFIWDLKSKKELCSQRHQQREDSCWISDPMNHDMLVCIDSEKVCSYSWSTLQRSEQDVRAPASTTVSKGSDTGGGARIRGTALSKDKRSLVYEVLPTTSPGGPHLSILFASSLSHSRVVPLGNHVKRLIGTLQNNVVFLDHDYWVCTWEIEARGSEVKRHFFLPKDWLNSSSLQMAAVSEQGTFFCPKFGEVVVVRNGIKIRCDIGVGELGHGTEYPGMRV